jgi:drug/metabolite transporter (DMT)-like permease
VTEPPPRSAFDRAIPALFVLIWATGFIVARSITTHAEPLTFLTVRLALTTLVFGAIVVLSGAAWPRTWRGWGDAVVSGVLLQGVYLGAVFWAARNGLPAGLLALIAGLQPILTAALAWPLLGERVGARRWAGIGLGCAGALLVLLPRLGTTEGVPPVAVIVMTAGMVAITIGTIWQKRSSPAADLRTNAAIQFLGAALITAPVAALLERGQFDGSWALWAALLWSVFGLSVGAISLLLLLIRRGAVAGVASLFYLVPPVVAVMAFALFGESLSLVQIAGMAIAVAGVALASRR